MGTCLFQGKFILCGSEAENKILKEAVKYFPSYEGSEISKCSRKIAIYTTTPRFGIVIDSKIRKKCRLILLNSKIFPEKFDPAENLTRFLVFTILHECAHIRGIAKEVDAHEQAIKWHNEYIQKNAIKVKQLDWNEKSDLEDYYDRRDWIFVSQKGDINDNIAGHIGKELVLKFIKKCDAEGKGVSTVLRTFAEDFTKA